MLDNNVKFTIKDVKIGDSVLTEFFFINRWFKIINNHMLKTLTDGEFEILDINRPGITFEQLMEQYNVEIRYEPRNNK